MNKINILIADDHPILRLGLRAMFEKTGHIRVISEAKTGQELLTILQQIKPDVILLDYFLGDKNGAQLTAYIRRINPKIKVLVFSHSSEPLIVHKSLMAGAIGFVSKEDNQAFLVDAIESVMKGHPYFSPAIRPVVQDLHDHKENKSQSLTQREFEILEYVAKEFSNKEIGALLFISPRTVETHKRNIMQKLKLKNSIGLVNFYFRKFKTGAIG